MSGEALENGTVNRTAVAPASASSARHVSIEERRRLVAESLQVGNPGNNARDLPDRADPRVECQIELAVDDIRPYENNPRRAGNAKFAEIKESIRASGIRNPLTVTRRPGENHFIVEVGGNTRLIAIQQLWAETRDPRFRKLTVLFRPWRSESHVLTSHLIENEQRGEMTFWDKAAGVAALKGRIEAEKGRVLSLRQLDEELTGLGLSVNTATLAHYLFAIERLRTLGEAVSDLSGLDVKTMQPRLNVMKRHAQAHASLTEADLYATVFEPVFRRTADEYRRTQTFSASAVCRACEEALARQLGEPVEQLRLALEAQSRSPQATSETMPVQAGVSRSIRPGAPTAVKSPPRPDAAISPANTETAAPKRHTRAAEALPPNGENPAVPSRLIEQVQFFASVAGIRECLRPHAAAPLGYYVEALPIPADAEAAPLSRQRAWWLLALIAGQLDDSASVTLLAVSAQPDPGTDRVVARDLSKPPNHFPLDAAFLTWLVDAHDETARAFWDLLRLIRESRASTPSPRELGSPIAVREGA